MTKRVGELGKGTPHLCTEVTGAPAPQGLEAAAASRGDLLVTDSALMHMSTGGTLPGSTEVVFGNWWEQRRVMIFSDVADT